jgi:hypothetical protein
VRLLSPDDPQAQAIIGQLAQLLQAAAATQPAAATADAAAPAAAGAAATPAVAPPTDPTSALIFQMAMLQGAYVRPFSLTAVPTAVNDDNVGTDHAQYIARQNLSSTSPSWFNVAADAGVQANDTAGASGDTLRSGPVGGPVPAAGGVSTITTAQGGTARLMADGSFNYLPPVNFTGKDTFQYVDTEFDAATGQQGQTSSAATVTILVATRSPSNLFTGGGSVTLDAASTWPKFHDTTDNLGSAPAGATRGSGANLLANPHLSFGVEGSPVVGVVSGSAAVFVETSNDVRALSPSTGLPFWVSPALGDNVKNAPAVVTVAGQGAKDFLVVGAANQVGSHANANLLVLDGNTGALSGSGFETQESFTESNGNVDTSVTGSIKSSPTVISVASNGGDNIPSFNGVVFGVDANAGGITNRSNGRMYAVRPDGSVAWETLVAGAIHGSPLFVPPSQDGTNPHGFIYVGSDNNGAWGGRPGAVPQGGRFYQIDALTGQITAEAYVNNGVIDGSALLVKGASQSDPTGTGATAHIILTDRFGEVFSVTQAVAAPPAGLESPTLTQAWEKTVGSSPTSPALSIDGAWLYVGDNQGLRVLSVSDGSQRAYVTSDGSNHLLGPMLGSPAVVADSSVGLHSQIVFGTNAAPPGVYDLLDTGTGAPTVQWELVSPKDSNNTSMSFGLSSPAIGPRNAGTQNAEIFIGAKEGGFLSIG